jgi:hypothetical protein
MAQENLKIATRCRFILPLDLTRSFVPSRVRVYITALSCESELVGRGGLQATGTASQLAEATGAWRYGKRAAFPTSPPDDDYGQLSNEALH